MPSDSFTVWLLSPLLFQSANLNVYGFFFCFFSFLLIILCQNPLFTFLLDGQLWQRFASFESAYFVSIITSNLTDVVQDQITALY